MSGGVAPRKTQDIGDVLDDFSLKVIGGDGREMSLSGALAGKRGAVVMFWSGICSHCVRYDGFFQYFCRTASRHRARRAGLAKR